MADVGPMVVPDGMSDEQVLFLTDILPTAWQACEQAEIKDGDKVAIWGAGPVGLFAVQCAKIMGAGQIIIIDDVPERIALAKKFGATDVVDFDKDKTFERLLELTHGEGPDCVIDCVGMESTAGHGIAAAISTIQEKLTATERPYVLNEVIRSVRPCGVVSIPGVYGSLVPVNMGAVVQKGLTLRSGQTHVKRYLEKLTKLIQEGKIDTTSMITHRSTDLAEGPDLYKTFRDKKDGCVKVVFHPN
jgi:threonine dehydrogenase-like Zn-dependent dehydrogenase